MNKVRIILIVASFVFNVPALNGQAGFRKGYIVRHDGDTLTGLVYYGLDLHFKHGCRFKRFEIMRDTRYGTEDMSFFGFRNGRHFELKNAGKKEEFYECLIKGPLSLYCVPGKPNGKLYMEHSTVGFMQLSGDMEILREITGIQTDSIPYKPEPIITMIKRSTDLSNETFRTSNVTPGVNWFRDYSVVKPNSLWNFGLTIGYQFLNIEIPGSSLTRFFDEADYNSSFRPGVGIYINRRLSKKSDLASVQLAFLYLEDRYYGYAEYSSISECRDYMTIDFKTIHIPLDIRFRLGKKNFHPYVKAGIYGSVLLNSSYFRFAERQFGSEIFTERYTDYHLENDWGLQAGVGLEIPLGHTRNISFEAGYMRGVQLLIYSENFYSESVDSKVLSKGFNFMFGINL
jgi:hypothetical protein